MAKTMSSANVVTSASTATGKVSAANDPLVAARRNNGVKGMKDGGKC